MIKKSLGIASAALLAGAMTLGVGTASAEIQNVKLKAVGTWANLTNYFGYEKPFYNKTLPKASGGKVTATVNPITELGL